jgi:nucleotide sugar dehydrogenase
VSAAAGAATAGVAAAAAAADEDAGAVRCAVVGLGFIGSTLMDALGAAGLEAHGYDRDPAAAARYRARERPQGAAATPWSAAADPAALAGAGVVLVAVRLPVDEAGEADLEPLRAAAALLRAHPLAGRLVLLASTSPPGTTRAFAGWLGEEAAAHVAHVPERISVGHDWRTLRDTPHLVGGVDAASTRRAARFMGRVCRAVEPVSSPEVSELSKLLENAFLSVGVALAGEVTRIAHGMGVSAAEVCAAAATKPFGYHPFHPGYGLGGHCLPTDLRLLHAASRAAGCESALLAAAQAAAALQPAVLVDRLAAALGGGTLAGARVLLVGVGFKPGSHDTSASPAFEVARVLRGRGALPAYLDSGVPWVDVDGVPLPRVTADGLDGERFDAALLLAGERGVTVAGLRRRAALVLDAGGGRVMDDPGGVAIRL